MKTRNRPKFRLELDSRNRKKKTYNWHFWIPNWGLQVVIDNGSYHGAIAHLKRELSYHNRRYPDFKFQFGQLSY